MKLRYFVVTLGFAMGIASGGARALVFDLETIPLTNATTSVSQTVGGLTLTLTRPGSNFAIVDQSGFNGVPASFGDRTLSPLNTLSATPFIGNFSAPVSNISITFGDFTPSDSDTVTIQAFSGPNGTGALLASITSAPCCSVGGNSALDPLFVSDTLLLTVDGASSISFIGGDVVFPQSLFHDNITATLTPSASVPEPRSLVLLGLALGALGLTRQRKTK